MGYCELRNEIREFKISRIKIISYWKKNLKSRKVLSDAEYLGDFIAEGFRDKALPKRSEPLTIPYKMYFGNLFKSWEGGVSLVNPRVFYFFNFYITNTRFFILYSKIISTPNTNQYHGRTYKMILLKFLM